MRAGAPREWLCWLSVAGCVLLSGPAVAGEVIVRCIDDFALQAAARQGKPPHPRYDYLYFRINPQARSFRRFESIAFMRWVDNSCIDKNYECKFGDNYYLITKFHDDKHLTQAESYFFERKSGELTYTSTSAGAQTSLTYRCEPTTDPELMPNRF